MKTALFLILFYALSVGTSFYYGYSSGRNSATSEYLQNSYKVTQKAKTRSSELKNSFESMNKKESELKNDQECSKYLFNRIPAECVRKSTAYYLKFL